MKSLLCHGSLTLAKLLLETYGFHFAIIEEPLAEM